MKRLLTVWLAFVLVALTTYAEPVTREQAQKKAEEFLNKQKKARRLSPVQHGRRPSAARRQAAVSGMDEYYVFNKGTREGFIIVSGDDQTEPILGYCDEGEFNYDQLPPALQTMLDGYADQIDAIRRGARPSKVPPTHPKVEQMMTSKWSQGSPYNDLCPLDAGRRSVTGCVATAMAQILYYQREKSVTETTAAIPGYSTWTKGISVSGIEAGAPLDWDNMRDTYGSATELQKRAVAQLMLYCGVAAKMDYTNSSSGAQSHDAYEAFAKYFGYGKSVRFVDYTTVTSDDEWDRIVYDEMQAGRPVYVSGANSEVGHAFVADGYDGNLRYHINWGWGGQSDGYYYLTNLTPGDGQGIGGSSDGYNGWKQIIVGIEPENFGEKAVSFSDATVRKICVEQWDADGDGKLTYNEAAAVTSLGDAFTGKTIKNFSELYYFNGLQSIDDHAFDGCTLLATVRLPKGLKKIGASAFKDCAKLPQVNLPTSVTEIGSAAFDGCKSLTAIELPAGIKAIEDYAFRNCATITSVNLPVNVAKIGTEAFAGCTGLVSFTVNTYQPDRITLLDNVFDRVSLDKATLHVMQGTKTYFEGADQWKDFGSIVQTRDISGGKFAELASGNTYYLYHLGTGRYLTRGEAYKTQAVVGTEPMRFKIVHPTTKPDGVYYLSSPDTGNDGKYLFRTSSDGNVGNGVKATFVDGKNLGDAAYWSVEETEPGVYVIQTPNSTAQQWLGVQTDHQSDAASPTYGAYWDVSDVDNCKWKLVSYDEQTAKTFAEAETLAKLLATAKKSNLRVTDEQAVYDNLDSPLEALQAAQSSLRKKLKLIEFYHPEVREMCISYFDSDTDGELSYKEAAEVTDFGWLFNFMNTTSLVRVEELQYFKNAQSIQGNFMQGCTNLETFVMPQGVEKIYYYAFKGCRKLTAINIPEYVNLIGEDAFEGCSALRTVTVGVADPASIELGNNVFGNVPLAKCTLQVPNGSKALYEKAPVWKNFGQIVEVRGRMQPKLSPITTDQDGYLMNISTRKYVNMGEAYGTQSVVERKGLTYQFCRTATTPDDVYFLCDAAGRIVFRTNTDTKVGSGVKACFGDGSVTAKSYWKVASVGDNIYTLQVPETDASYVADEYLGVDESHKSDAASPTYGLYWDVKGEGTYWGFVTVEDYEAAKQGNAVVDELAEILTRARKAEVDVTAEQAVYDNFESSVEELSQAVRSVREKLHYITFSDSRVRSLCLQNWDTDGDDELSREEAAAVTSIDEVFTGNNAIKNFDELRYFTSLTELPKNAFRNALSLQNITLPAGIASIGEYAFTGCSELKFIVMLSEQHFVPMGIYGIPNKSVLFVPAAMLSAYQNDPEWTEKCRVTEYTGRPVVTAEATRQYGRTAATINVLIEGAPVEGTPECVCEAVADRTLPVGTYPITVLPGTVTTQGVELKDGVFTIEPAPLTITAKSYTRQVGQPNPTFEVSYKGFRNGEKEEALTVKPVVSCEASETSPAGTYAITPSGAEAANYTMNYVAGTLTVEDPTAVSAPTADDGQRQTEIYDLQGRRTTQPRRGIYIQGRRKTYKR